MQELAREFPVIVPEYQKAVQHFYQRHLLRLPAWPTGTKVDFNIPLYEYMWGPSEFTMTGTLASLDLFDNLVQLSMPVLITCGRF